MSDAMRDDKRDIQRDAKRHVLRSQRRPCLSRRGISVIVVMLLLAVALSMSYALMRSQATNVAIEQNSDRLADARHAARTGLQVGLATMHRSNDWGGVGSTLSGTISASESYTVTYTTGDPSLTSSDPDWYEYPLRVTLESTGYALVPTQSAVPTVHKMRAVVRLVPTAMPDEPTDWPLFQQYTAFQADDNKAFQIELPSRIEGPVRVQGTLSIAELAPDTDASRNQYLSDLEALRQLGLTDYRPFTGPVTLRMSGNVATFFRLNRLGVTAQTDNTVTVLSPDWVQPAGFTTYRLYLGGESYSVGVAAATLANTTLGPDTLTNPLGLFYCDNSVAVGDNVTVRGSLFASGDITIQGTNVQFQPVDLPALNGSTTLVRLPVITCKKFSIADGAGGSITGFVAVFEDFDFVAGTENMYFAITGRLVAGREFRVQDRNEWILTNWTALFTAFSATTFPAGDLAAYFPVYAALAGRNPTPFFTLTPDPSPVTYHWHDPAADTPVYSPLPTDTGLHWDVLEYTENP